MMVPALAKDRDVQLDMSCDSVAVKYLAEQLELSTKTLCRRDSRLEDDFRIGESGLSGWNRWKIRAQSLRCPICNFLLLNWVYIYLRKKERKMVVSTPTEGGLKVAPLCWGLHDAVPSSESQISRRVQKTKISRGGIRMVT